MHETLQVLIRRHTDYIYCSVVGCCKKDEIGMYKFTGASPRLEDYASSGQTLLKHLSPENMVTRSMLTYCTCKIWSVCMQMLANVVSQRNSIV